MDHLRTEYHRVKSCAPMCTVGCVHRVAQVDELREDPERTLAQLVRVAGSGPAAAPSPAGQDAEMGVRHEPGTRSVSPGRRRMSGSTRRH